MAEMYSWDNLEKKYHNRVVLDITHIEFEKGKSYIIAGENGAGKSTLLKMLAGVIDSDLESVFPKKSINVSYLPQKPYIFDLSVIDNMKISSPYKAEKKIEKILKELDIFKLKKSKATTLSGGEKQRLAFGRIIVQPCQILLLDEPSSAMDENGTRLFEKLVLEYQKDNGCTIIMSTHDMEQAKRMTENIIYMKDGRII